MSEGSGKTDRIASMTGYGRSAAESPIGRITVEVRSLNHRYLDVMLRAPRALMHLDNEIRNITRERVARGKVELFLSLEDSLAGFEIDTEQALNIARSLGKVADAVGDKVRLEHILEVGQFTPGRDPEIDEEIGALILDTVSDALDRMIEHRYEEGAALADDLSSRLEELKKICASIRELAEHVPVRSRQHITQFLEDLELGEKIEPQRLEMEVAILAQRSDITEEMTRLTAHSDSFSQGLECGGVVGRRLEFLIQEMQREINTIGSKSGMPEISAHVVDFKTGLEKIREQVQNIE